MTRLCAHANDTQACSPNLPRSRHSVHSCRVPVEGAIPADQPSAAARPPVSRLPVPARLNTAHCKIQQASWAQLQACLAFWRVRKCHSQLQEQQLASSHIGHPGALIQRPARSAHELQTPCS